MLCFPSCVRCPPLVPLLSWFSAPSGVERAEMEALAAVGGVTALLLRARNFRSSAHLSSGFMPRQFMIGRTLLLRFGLSASSEILDKLAKTNRGNSRSGFKLRIAVEKYPRWDPELSSLMKGIQVQRSCRGVGMTNELLESRRLGVYPGFAQRFLPHSVASSKFLSPRGFCLDSSSVAGSNRRGPIMAAKKATEGGLEEVSLYENNLDLPRTKFSMKANSVKREPEIRKLWEQKQVLQKLLERNTGNSVIKGNCRKLHGAAAFISDYTEADQAASAPWPTVRRPVSETLLKSYAHHTTVVQPLILHGPRGVGKRTLTEELMKEWSKPPHVVAFVNLSSTEEQLPWFEGNQITPQNLEAVQSGESESSLNLGTVRYKVEEGLEYLASKAVNKGLLKSDDVLAIVLQHYAVDGALSEFLRTHRKDSDFVESVISSRNTNDMWKAALQQVRDQFVSGSDTGALLNHSGSTRNSVSQSGQAGLDMLEKPRSQVLVREDAILSLALAQQLLKIHETWRTPAKDQLRKKGIIAKVQADAATSYSVLLLRLISGCVQEGKFQPKLIINNLELMRKAAPEYPEDSLHGALYHDSLLMQVSKLGFDHGCIPIIAVSSDGYYSSQLFDDYGDENAFISQEMLGWTPKEAAIHLVPAIFEEPEWKVISTVLGSNVRHLKELHSIWHHPSFLEMMEENSGNAIEDCIDLYLGYLQVTAVDPAMEAAAKLLETFAADVTAGKISRSRLKHGAPWRHPPRTLEKQRRWARLQLIDYIQALADTDFAINHREEKAKEFLEDPSTDALLEVGLFYKQREPPYLRPVTRAIARCLVRWQVRERLKLSVAEEMTYRWHRLIRGRYYRQLTVI